MLVALSAAKGEMSCKQHKCYSAYMNSILYRNSMNGVPRNKFWKKKKSVSLRFGYVILSSVFMLLGDWNVI